MNILATVVEGNADLADILFLAAFIVAVVGVMVFAMARAVGAALECSALALVALAFLVV
jgi:hypothetical protein